ncbi:MAG: hypothetical protein JWN13_5235 [Betaproteobacteria bacterium]|nr:hypothetical protein [Betaproteobacteria bacterium]
MEFTNRGKPRFPSVTSHRRARRSLRGTEPMRCAGLRPAIVSLRNLAPLGAPPERTETLRFLSVTSLPSARSARFEALSQCGALIAPSACLPSEARSARRAYERTEGNPRFSSVTSHPPVWHALTRSCDVLQSQWSCSGSSIAGIGQSSGKSGRPRCMRTGAKLRRWCGVSPRRTRALRWSRVPYPTFVSHP